jgi:tetratricopeptide (TPR) repeat protein
VATEIFRSSELAVRSVCDFRSKTCVITFDAYADDRSLDRPGFGEGFFQVHQIDAIHFLSRENDWYQYPDLPSVARKVAELVKTYDRVVAYGSSMGAYAAIRFGGLAGASVALAISPQFSINPRVARFERRWKLDSERIDFVLERQPPGPFVKAAYLVYDPNDADGRHAEMFRRHTRVIDVRLADVGHPATGSLAALDLLTDLVLDVVNDRLDVDALTRQVDEGHKASAHFHYVMSTRAFGGRRRIAHAGRAAAMASEHFGFVAHYASLLAASGRFAEAQIAFARAATIAPDHPVLLYKLTEFHQRRGDLESAIEAAELLVSLHSQTFLPRLNQLRRLHDRLGRRRFGWPNVTIAGRRIVGNPSLPLDVRVTTTPSPPPFVESWRRHEGLMAARPEKVDVFLVGDSLAEYWPEDLWAPLSVFNFGVKADKTQHTLWRLAQLPPASVDCRHAVILLGTNNLGAGDTSVGIAAGIAAVAAGVVRVAPRARVWVIGTPPARPEGQEFRPDVRRRANATVAGIGGFDTVDADAALAASETALCYEPDGIHLGRSAYQRLTHGILSQIE